MFCLRVYHRCVLSERAQELEALADHYTVLCIRARGKLAGEERAAFDARLKALQGMLSLGAKEEGGEKGGAKEGSVKEEGKEKEKGKEKGEEGGGGGGGEFRGGEEAGIDREEWQALLAASKGKAKEMTAGYAPGRPSTVPDML